MDLQNVHKEAHDATTKISMHYAIKKTYKCVQNNSSTRITKFLTTNHYHTYLSNLNNSCYEQYLINTVCPRIFVNLLCIPAQFQLSGYILRLLQLFTLLQSNFVIERDHFQHIFLFYAVILNEINTAIACETTQILNIIYFINQIILYRIGLSLIIV